jgi:hypothetical protein
LREEIDTILKQYVCSTSIIFWVMLTSVLRASSIGSFLLNKGLNGGRNKWVPISYQQLYKESLSSSTNGSHNHSFFYLTRTLMEEETNGYLLATGNYIKTLSHHQLTGLAIKIRNTICISWFHLSKSYYFGHL